MMFLKTAPLAVGIAGVLFASAGRGDLPALYAYPAVLWIIASLIYTVLLRRRPDLVAERLNPPSDRDRATRRMALPLMMLHLIIAGVDVGRLGWSEMAAPLQVAGFLLVAGALLLVGWTLASNPFASSAVRIQRERNHQVVTSGPYALVRHPMYFAVVLFALGSGPALGSWPAALALLPVIAVFVRRTLLEDRMLHAELAGYSAYAARVRWRVLPGVF